MRLTEQQIKTLEPCIRNVTRSGKSVTVVCAGAASGKRALSVITSVYSPASVDLLSGTERMAIVSLWQFWVYPFRYRDFELTFSTEAEAKECADDLSGVIVEAVGDGVDGQGIQSWFNSVTGNLGNQSGNDFFHSTFFYAAVAILVVYIVVVVGVKVMQHKKH